MVQLVRVLRVVRVIMVIGVVRVVSFLGETFRGSPRGPSSQGVKRDV